MQRERTGRKRFNRKDRTTVVTTTLISPEVAVSSRTPFGSLCLTSHEKSHPDRGTLQVIWAYCIKSHRHRWRWWWCCRCCWWWSKKPPRLLCKLDVPSQVADDDYDWCIKNKLTAVHGRVAEEGEFLFINSPSAIFLTFSVIEFKLITYENDWPPSNWIIMWERTAEILMCFTYVFLCATRNVIIMHL